MKKIIAITVRNKDIIDQTISDKMIDATYCQQVMMGNLIHSTETVDELDLSNYDADVILIQKAGDIIIDIDKFWRILNSIPDEVKSIGSINDCLILNKGGTIEQSFDSSWDRIRFYVEPEINTQLFYQCFKTLTINDNLTDIQKRWITALGNYLRNNNILAPINWNTIPKSFQSADLIISPAFGFMGESMAWYNGAEKIIFYDMSPHKIEFKKYVYENFNGKNYGDFYKKYAKDNNLVIENPPSNTNNEHYEDHKLVLDNWDYFKNLEKEYIIGDIFDNIDVLLSKMSEQTILHTSTILGYYPVSHGLHDRNEFYEVIDKITERTSETNSLWYGSRLTRN